MYFLRLVIGAPLVLVGMLLVIVSGGVLAAGSDAIAGAAIMAFIGVALAWAGWKFVRGRREVKDWRDDPATPKQKAYARDLRIKFPKGIRKGPLSDLISQAAGENVDFEDDDEDE